MIDNPGEEFDAYYYKTSCGRPYQRDDEWLAYFDAIAARVVREVNPHTVLDAGCAMGFLVEGLRNRGVEAYGVDISEYSIQNVHSSIRPYCWVGSIVDPFPQKYDLVISIEVLEHMPKADADRAVENFCQHTDAVLFSSGTQDLREITHINIQPPEYWASLFARQGFFRDVDFDGSFLTAWTVLFRRKNEPAHRIIMDYERRIDRLIQENYSIRQVNLEQKRLLAHKENELLSFQAQMTAQLNSREYRAAQKLRKLVPVGSRREKMALWLWKVFTGLPGKKTDN